MAIQMRRGNQADFSPSRLVSGEFAVSLDQQRVYMCIGAGNVIELAIKGSIEEFVEEAEAWARGTKNGTPVSQDDPAYQDNSEYWHEQAAAEAANSENFKVDSEAWARGTRDNVPVPEEDETYHNNSKYYAESVGETASDSEAWAVGQRSGTDVPSTDPTYHNNSKFFAERAASMISSGIATVHRVGLVKPDGATITIAADGTITSVGGGGGGGGDMSTSVYDANYAVAQAGGIASYVSGQTSDKYATGDTAETTLDDADYVPFYDTSATAKRKTLWSNIKSVLKTYFDTLYSTFSGDYNDLTNKPTVDQTYGATSANAQSGVAVASAISGKQDTMSAGNGITVSSNKIYNDGVISASLEDNGTASSATVKYQRFSKTVRNGTSSATTVYEIKGTKHMEIANTSGTSYSFTNGEITSSSAIDVYTDSYGDNPSNVTVSSNTCTVTFASSRTRTVRIYIK